MRRPTGTNPVGMTASSLAALVRSGEATPVEMVQAHLAHLAARDPRVGAFQHVRAEAALVDAAALAARADLRSLPLAGVPIAIKDNVAVAGEPMRVGSRATPDVPCETDHPAVRQLRAAGAIVLGITRVPELCVWGTTDNAFGLTRNPWNPDRTSGGSSGGSAAAVAAKMVPIAHGADGLGSIRIPAASCGVIGLKPGTGIVPADLGATSWYAMAENGPIATTVEDAALMLSVLADRPDFTNPHTVTRPLRIAISTRPPLQGITVDPEIAAATTHVGDALAGGGHHVEPADPPAPALRSIAGIFARWCAGVAQDAERLDSRALEPRTRTHVRLGRTAQLLGLVRPQDAEHWHRRADAFFRRFDLLITPVLATTALPALPWGRRSWVTNLFANLRFAPYSAPWNLAGYPAAAVPAGLHSDGLPLSVQLIAPRGGEHVILSVARDIERLRPWPRHPVEQSSSG